jgi:cytidine deaminase
VLLPISSKLGINNNNRMEDLKIDLRFKVYDSSKELDKTLGELVNKARSAADDAYAPYSKFNVGAAVLLEDDTVITGNNQENAAYPSGLCAERVAIFSASAVNPNVTIKAIAVYAYGQNSSYEEPVTPCGSCRQALLEYENRQDRKIPVYMMGKNGKIIRAESIGALLPLAFGSFQLTGGQ